MGVQRRLIRADRAACDVSGCGGEIVLEQETRTFANNSSSKYRYVCDLGGEAHVPESRWTTVVPRIAGG